MRLYYIKNRKILFVIHNYKNKKNILKYVLVGFSGGLLLEGLAQWIFKLWFYPFWTNYFYFFVFAFGFSFYFLMITESYLVIKVLIDKKTKGTKRITKPFKNENIVYKFLFVLGIIFFIFGIGSLMSNYESLDLEFNINIIKQYKMPFYDIIMIFFGVWFILEFVEFKLHRTSLIKDMTHKYYNPFLSILISSFLLATIIETQNLGVGLWEYFNWPYPEIKFLGIPLFVYLIWPLHYIGFLSLFRVMDIKLSLSIWKGDEIK